ncbi:hypothetical protein EDB85DRAFT_1201931 [Lactarius pseudohatsudake]|nr:hypothetical protein EDB85DRAFT_1201931 [Lactarius pseudohatsudake]
MDLIEWLGFCLSILGTYGVVIYLRLLIPCYIIPNVSSMLNNAERSLAHAVTIGALPEMSDYRVDLEILASRFARMRIESHRSPGVFPQIWLAVRHGLTCRLYSLASQIRAVGREVEFHRWRWTNDAFPYPQLCKLSLSLRQSSLLEILLYLWPILRNRRPQPRLP